jgi:thioredoxin 1
MHPIAEEIGKELNGDGRVLKIDIEKNEILTNHYKIQSIPTFIIFKNREIVWCNSGITEKQTLFHEIKKYVDKKLQ